MSCNLIQITKMAQAISNIGQPTRSQIRFLAHFDGVGVESATVYREPVNGRSFLLQSGATFSPDAARFGATGVKFVSSATVLGDMNSADYLTGDFTIEMWVKIDSLAGQNIRGLFNMAPISGANGLGFGIRSSGKPILRQNTGAAIDNFTEADVSLNVTQGVWNHIAVTCKAGLLRMWINGNPTPQVTKGGTVYAGNNFQLGYFASVASFAGTGVHIDEFRYVNGMAVYTEPFTPQNTEFATPSA